MKLVNIGSKSFSRTPLDLDCEQSFLCSKFCGEEYKGENNTSEQLWVWVWHTKQWATSGVGVKRQEMPTLLAALLTAACTSRSQCHVTLALLTSFAFFPRDFWVKQRLLPIYAKSYRLILKIVSINLLHPINTLKWLRCSRFVSFSRLEWFLCIKQKASSRLAFILETEQWMHLTGTVPIRMLWESSN